MSCMSKYCSSLGLNLCRKTGSFFILPMIQYPDGHVLPQLLSPVLSNTACQRWKVVSPHRFLCSFLSPFCLSGWNRISLFFTMIVVSVIVITPPIFAMAPDKQSRSQWGPSQCRDGRLRPGSKSFCFGCRFSFWFGLFALEVWEISSRSNEVRSLQSSAVSIAEPNWG
jgi:hypothetical protein